MSEDELCEGSVLKGTSTQLTWEIGQLIDGVLMLAGSVKERALFIKST